MSAHVMKYSRKLKDTYERVHPFFFARLCVFTLVFVIVLLCDGSCKCMCACGGKMGALVPLRAHLFCTLCPVN